MRGHQPIIAARRQGFVPASVWLHDLPAGQRPERERFPWPTFGSAASVDIEATDSPARLDLRFLVGMQVFVMADRAERLEALESAAKAAKAKRVLGHLFADSRQGPQLVRITDTEGAMTWRA